MWILRLNRKFLSARRGSVYIELAAVISILSAIFIGSAVISSKTIDFDRDSRASRAGVDMAWVLDSDMMSPGQSDFDAIGQAILEATRADPSEDFQIYFTAVEFDHNGAGLRVDWQGSYGTSPGLSSRISILAPFVTVNGYDFSVEDDERLIIVEIYRTRRGLFVDVDKPVYSYAVSLKYDPVHA